MTVSTIRPRRDRRATVTNPRNDQAARYQQLLSSIADHRQRGILVVNVRLADLEALIALAASTDAALQVA